MKASILPTLPSAAAIDGPERLALLAGLSFVEGATSGWSARDLSEWFRTHASALGCAHPPSAVYDAAIGGIALVPGAKVASEKVARAEALPKLLAMARWRVVLTMRGLLATPCDDRFLHAAIFADRVRRERCTWLAQPRETDLLSDVVLSLFAVDVLTYRDFHAQNLCVCDVCGRLSYNPAQSTRAGCADHVPKSDTTSGFEQKRPRSSIPPAPAGA